MGDVTVYFGGICTHIRTPNTPQGVAHRVVLVNGVVNTTINEHAIASHVAAVEFSADDLLSASNIRLPEPIDGKISWQVGGARLTIANASPVGLSYSSNWSTCIPSLTQLTPNAGSLSAQVVDASDQLLASCYFDVNDGVFNAGTDNSRAAIAVLQCAVDGDDPVISAESFVWGSGSFTLRSGAAVHVTNFGSGPGKDSAYDFLLHYRVLQSIPPDARVPLGTGGCPPLNVQLVPKPLDVGPGCSNSAYP